MIIRFTRHLYHLHHLRTGPRNMLCPQTTRNRSSISAFIFCPIFVLTVKLSCAKWDNVIPIYLENIQGIFVKFYVVHLNGVNSRTKLKTCSTNVFTSTFCSIKCKYLHYHWSYHDQSLPRQPLSAPCFNENVYFLTLVLIIWLELVLFLSPGVKQIHSI